MGEKLEMKNIEAAAEQGNTKAQFNLGRMYCRGEGTEVNYNEIYLPISKEDFLDSLNLSIYVSYDKDESDIFVDGYINCEPDYFAGHSIEFIVDGKGNFEIEGLAG